MKKFENYLRLNKIIDIKNNGYLSGGFVEYYESGETRLSGSYQIVEFLSEDIIFDPENYEEKKICCTWKPISIESGKWTYYDEEGKITRQEIKSMDINELDNYREISDGFKERIPNINKTIRNSR